jgi:predicted ATPase
MVNRFWRHLIIAFAKACFYSMNPKLPLSPQRQLTLLSILNNMEHEGKSQFYYRYPFAHFAGLPGCRHFLLDEEGITKVKYRDTEHYQITKSFLDNPEYYFKLLFE